ncbi:MAG: Dabb family protein [Syntrophobacterales bacterium]|nr:Dabb family protein [Syntrophobacterales bacterium]
MIKHVIVIKFKEGVTDEEKSRLEEMLGRLPSLIKEIKGFLFGRDVLRYERSYDFALVSDFDDLEALKKYKIHPEHVKVLQYVQTIAEQIIAVDFEY